MNQETQATTNTNPAARPERRHSVRYRCEIPVEIRTPGVSFPSQGSTTDVSLGGCYVSTRFNLGVGQQVELKLWVDGVAVVTKAIVRTSDPGVGDGMQFLQLDAASERVLGEFFARLETNPEPATGSTIRDMLII